MRLISGDREGLGAPPSCPAQRWLPGSGRGQRAASSRGESPLFPGATGPVTPPELRAGSLDATQASWARYPGAPCRTPGQVPGSRARALAGSGGTGRACLPPCLAFMGNKQGPVVSPLIWGDRQAASPAFQGLPSSGHTQAFTLASPREPEVSMPGARSLPRHYDAADPCLPKQ